MSYSIYDLIEFHKTSLGGAVRHVISDQLQALWPDARGLRIVGIGCAAPYLEPFLTSADRVVAVGLPTTGAYPWPEGSRNLVCLSEEGELPLETNSVDRVVLLHALEHVQDGQALFAEIWRVLKSNGRLLIFVPNRLGLWARMDWTPFGHGRPFTVGQITRLLRDRGFLHERTTQSLFMLPLGSRLMLRTAPLFERYGRFILPALAGLHVVEASKQLYAGTAIPVAAPVRARFKGTPALVPGATSR